jgi:isoquinoline 1-oxidoreductase alpha subunit
LKGLSKNNDHPLQLAWQEIDVAAMRLLPFRPVNVGRRFIERKSQSHGRRVLMQLWRVIFAGVALILRIRKAIHLAAEMQRKRS